MTDLDKYKADVDGFFRDNSPKVFGNYTQDHANYVIHKLLESAENSMVLLSGKYPCDFYDELCKDFESAVERIARSHGTVRIITADGTINEKLLQFAEKHKEVVEYRPAKYNGEVPISHFMVVDGKRYRLERPHEVVDNAPDPVNAEVCCNGKDKADELISFFDSVWKVLNPAEGKK